MKRLNSILLLAFALFTLTACSESSSAPDSAPQAENNGEQTDARQNTINAAAEKISRFDADVSAEQAQQIVLAMVEGNVIGLGEVVTMNFIDLSDNSERLVAAYQKAKADVVGE